MSTARWLILAGVQEFAAVIQPRLIATKTFVEVKPKPLDRCNDLREKKCATAVAGRARPEVRFKLLIVVARVRDSIGRCLTRDRRKLCGTLAGVKCKYSPSRDQLSEVI
jgi:hypothetical protein